MIITKVFFCFFLQYFKDFGDIIKETVSKSKLISPVQSAKTICLSLQQVCTYTVIKYFFLTTFKKYMKYLLTMTL